MKKDYKSEVMGFEYGCISFYDEYIRVVYYDNKKLLTLVKDYDEFEIKWCYFTGIFKRINWLPKIVKIYIKNYNKAYWAYKDFNYYSINYFYLFEIKKFFKIYKLNSINCFFFDKLQFTIVDLPCKLTIKELNIRNCLVNHYVDHIFIKFKKKDSYIALKICRLKTHTGLDYLEKYTYLKLKFDVIEVEVSNLSDFEFLRILELLNVDDFCLEFALKDIDDHRLLYNYIILIHDKFHLENELLKNFK